MKLPACQQFDPTTPPEGWVVEPLKCRLRLEYGSGLVEQERNDGDYGVYGSNGRVGSHSQYLVEGPGILVGRKGSVGEVHFTEQAFWPIDTVYYVRRLRQDNWHYLYYLLTFLNLGRLNAATGVPGLTRRDAHFMLGAFPPPFEQDVIAATLQTVQDATLATKNEIDKARRLKTALLQQLFRKGIPGCHLRFVQTKIGAIPEAWDVRTVQSVLAEPPFSGVSPESRSEPPGTPILNVSCIKQGRCDPGAVTFVDVDATTLEQCKARKGDFYVLRGNGNREYVGSGGLLDIEPPENCIFSDKLIRLRFNPNLVAEDFIPLMWQSHVFLRRLQSKAESGSGLWMMSKREIRRELFAYPPMDEQRAIVQAIRAAQATIDSVESKHNALERVKRSLLKNLLTGQVRLQEAATV